MTTINPLEPLPATIGGVSIALAERHYNPVRQYFLTALLAWLRTTKLSATDVQGEIDALQSAVRQLHEMSKARAAEVTQ